MFHKALATSLLVSVLLNCASCASIPYQRLDRTSLTRSTPTTPPGEPQFERGDPNTVLDAIGWVVGVPSKIILWDRRLDNHRVGTNTEAVLTSYLEGNGLSDVKVRINQYAPLREFRRLVRNKGVSWGWRYSIGVLSWLYQTILPGRIFGGDSYNPYTDTISLYSDAPTVALHEGGHAKDFAGKTMKGTYAFSYILPVFSLYAEARASNDAVSYLYAHGSADEEKEAYRLLYPAMGTYVGGMFGGGALSPLSYVAVIPGHIVGRSKAAHVDEERAWRPPADPLTKQAANQTEPPAGVSGEPADGSTGTQP